MKYFRHLWTPSSNGTFLIQSIASLLTISRKCLGTSDWASLTGSAFKRTECLLNILQNRVYICLLRLILLVSYFQSYVLLQRKAVGCSKDKQKWRFPCLSASVQRFQRMMDLVFISIEHRDANIIHRRDLVSLEQAKVLKVHFGHAGSTWPRFWPTLKAFTTERSLCNPCKRCTKPWRTLTSNLKEEECLSGRTEGWASKHLMPMASLTCKLLTLQKSSWQLVKHQNSRGSRGISELQYPYIETLLILSEKLS